MTHLHLIYIASAVGAVLFFVAGATTVALRRRTPAVDVAAEAARAGELAQLRAAVQTRGDQLAALQLERSAVATQAEARAKDLATARTAVRQAEARAAQLTEELAAARAATQAAEQAATKATARATAQTAAQSAAQSAAHNAAQAVQQAQAAQATAQAAQATAHAAAQAAQAAATAATERAAHAEARAERLAAELERSRTEATAGAGDAESLRARLADLERQLAERTDTGRDLSIENEQLKGKLRDAEGLRTEYVRLRTAATDAEFLKAEVERLEAELRALNVEALGAGRPRPARGSIQPQSPGMPTIGESLTTAIDRFADDGTRSIAVADTMGFPLASNGTDGVALAAYAALLMESATKSRQFLPVSAPVGIEIVDERGTRVSVWTFEVDGDRLMLANLAVTPVDAHRLEATLADLSAILAVPQPESYT
jgi:chemotaxis protein histidine kinase CheA